MPRKIPTWCPSCADDRLVLQWGRGSDASEDGSGSTSTGTAVQLQWGRGSDASEDTHLAVSGSRWFKELQWGRGSDASEDAIVEDAQSGAAPASMGPRQ